jgi:hypothetical protein
MTRAARRSELWEDMARGLESTMEHARHRQFAMSTCMDHARGPQKLEATRLSRSCEVDYALGGGSSGGVLRDGGARTISQPASCSSTDAGSSATISEATAAGAHGAMEVQLAGAHGREHGARSLPGACCGTLGMGGPPPMSICAMPAEALPSLIPGIAHAKPLPRTMNWSTSRRAAMAEKGRERLMALHG